MSDFPPTGSGSMAGEERRRAERLLRSTLDALSAHIAILDEHGVIIEVNAAWADFATANDFAGDHRGIGDNYLGVCDAAAGRHSAEAPAVAGGIRAVMAGERSEFHLEYPCHSPTEQRWFVVRVTRFEVDGAVRVVVAHENVTKRRSAEEALRDSEQRFVGAFEFAPIGMGLVSPDLRWLRVNRALCEIVGYAEVELLARTTQDITHPEDLGANRENLRGLLAGEIEAFQIEKRLQHAQGHSVLVQLHVSLVRDAASRPLYLVAQVQDITAQKRAETELRTKTAFLEAQVNTSIDGILVVDEHGRKVLQNQRTEELFRIPPEIAHSSDDAAQIRWVREATADPEAFVRKVVHLYAHPHEISRDEIELKDGRFIDRYSSPVLGADGKYYGRIWTFRDISESKQVHRELVAASRQAGMAEVATGVLHNVGNVLNSVNISATVAAEKIRGFKLPALRRLGELLRGQEDLSEFFARDPRGAELPGFLLGVVEQLESTRSAVLDELGALLRHVEHVNEIVAMQQDYAHAGGITEELPLAGIIEEALRLNAGSIERHGLEIVRAFADLPAVPVDRHKVLQILVNLIRNAEHALDDGGPAHKLLTLGLAANAEGGVRIIVTDNGIGIPSENLTRIFEQGFTTRKGGHGFGLHTSALAARELGGSLIAQSAGPGLGATFVLELPQPASTHPTA